MRGPFAGQQGHLDFNICSRATQVRLNLSIDMTAATTPTAAPAKDQVGGVGGGRTSKATSKAREGWRNGTATEEEKSRPPQPKMPPELHEGARAIVACRWEFFQQRFGHIKLKGMSVAHSPPPQSSHQAAPVDPHWHSGNSRLANVARCRGHCVEWAASVDEQQGVGGERNGGCSLLVLAQGDWATGWGGGQGWIFSCLLVVRHGARGGPLHGLRLVCLDLSLLESCAMPVGGGVVSACVTSRRALVPPHPQKSHSRHSQRAVFLVSPAPTLACVGKSLRLSCWNAPRPPFAARFPPRKGPSPMIAVKSLISKGHS